MLIMGLDKDTKFILLHKHQLMKINDALDENFQYGQIGCVAKWLKDPNNKWKQPRVDEAIKILDEYYKRRTDIENS